MTTTTTAATRTDADATPNTSANAATEPVRLHADHNALKRLGNWTTADHFEVRSRRGSVVLDLRSPHLPPGDLVIDLDLDRSMVKLLVPDETVVDYADVQWTANGKVKDGIGQQYARTGEFPKGGRHIRLTGRIHNGEVRIARGGVAMLAAMFSREYVEDVKRSRREGTMPTVDDPARGA
jgi:hypothetical protein